MIQPTLENINSSRDIIDAFEGYNHNLRIGSSQFYDMKNLTSSHYPILSARCKRGTYEYPEGSGDNHSPNGLITKDALCYVDGTKFYINNKEVVGLELSNTPKQLVSMGAYVIIMPDKMWVNTLPNGEGKYSDFGNIEYIFNADGDEIAVNYSLCRADGNAQNITISRDTEPTDADVDGGLNSSTVWLDTSANPHTLKQYSAATKTWTPIATTYVKISAPNIAKSINQYDAVKISGIHTDLAELKDLEGQISPIWYAYHDSGDTTEGSERAEGTDDYIVVVGMLSEERNKISKLKLERTMPNLDFIIESNNRLWGCRYGEDVNGNVVNEIYASKLGDFKNWNCFMGLSTDSYTASCGTDGQWTGAITHLGYPIFFKENFMHKVYGNYPANFQIQSTACRGVQKGAGNSLAIVNGMLFYKSRSGVCVYDGSLPTEISSAFGDIHYSAVDINNTDALRNGAVAGSLNNKYYISMKSEVDNEWYLFVYDATTGMWHKEDNTRADAFCACDGELYYIDHNEKKIKTMLGSGTKDTIPTEWMAETGIIGTSMPDKKYISRLLIRMSLGLGSSIRFSIQYDSCGEWEQVYLAVGTNLRSFNIPIKPKRCDHFRLRMVGTGEAKIFSITKTIEQGSDV